MNKIIEWIGDHVVAITVISTVIFLIWVVSFSMYTELERLEVSKKRMEYMQDRLNKLHCEEE